MTEQSGYAALIPRVRIVEVQAAAGASVAGEGGPPVTLPQDVAKLVKPWAERDREVFLAIHLDTRKNVLAVEVVAVGTLNAALVHPREVFKAAILQNAAAVILAHNHPSGDPTPSLLDIDLMRRLMQAGEILGIDVVDSIVFTRDRFVSMREMGLM